LWLKGFGAHLNHPESELGINKPRYARHKN
jgi:hypothetical protein